VTIQPRHRRIDAALVVRDAVAAALPGSQILLDRDAEYTPDQTVTVVSVPTVRAAGALPGARWAFDVTVSLTTTGPDFDAAADEADLVGDAVLSLTGFDDVRFSSVRCDSEPVRLSPHNPTGAETLAQTFSLIVRRGA
jgi:hypothetical protein